MLMNTRTLCTTNSINLGLNCTVDYENSFTSGCLGAKYTLVELKMPICLAHFTSFLATHLWSLSILVKTNFPFPMRLTTTFSFLLVHFWFLCSSFQLQYLLFFPFHLSKFLSLCLFSSYILSFCLIHTNPHYTLKCTRMEKIGMQRLQKKLQQDEKERYKAPFL